MIGYSYTQEFTKHQLKKLFRSVNWESAAYPEKLKQAMNGYTTVITAWDVEELVGLICAMDDGVMTAYIHYLLVDPEYHGQTIGRTLVEMTKEKYKDYLRTVLIAYKNETHFYEKCGFKIEEKSLPMCITSLWT
ncbi:GNAT family N-acetyltransferase [Ruminococcus sp.]|uniref:GNAT family N-acetyltransferase n=1 Tax=Ruminococcus sp. TaxID=41978 RepID=UPI00258F88F6|nr:GNAT family N-acetyltransferase [Ruminococcus sp.]MCR5021718.1 GNAT family N-acetyltransferase [Ruminococcus sp.]